MARASYRRGQPRTASRVPPGYVRVGPFSASSVSNFSSTPARYFKYVSTPGTDLPQLGPGQSIVVLVDDVSTPSGYLLCCEQTGTYNGRGWRLAVANSSGSGKFQLDIGATSKQSTRVFSGRGCIAISCDGTGRYKSSVNGAPVEDHGVVAYTPVAAGDTVAIGILAWNQGIGFQAQGLSVCEFVAINRMLSDAELVAASGVANALDRTVLSSTFTADASATCWWRAGTHWNGSAGTSTTGGSVPITFTVSGTPTLNAVTETVYPLRGSSLLADGIAISDQGAYMLRSSFARLRCTTSATRIAADIVAQATTPNGLGALNSGALVSVTGALTRDGTRQVVDITLPAGAGKTIDLVESGQQLAGALVGANTALVAVRQVGSSALTIARPVPPSSRIVVFGDSISQGITATTPVTQGWTMLMRADYTGGVSVYGAGSIALQTVGATSDTRATLAQRLCQAASVTSGARIVWLAIGTNDYGGPGGGAWSAASFQAAYADLLDKIHAMDAGAVVYAQSPIVRTVETANSFGSTMADYRAAVSTSCSGRAWATYVDGTTLMTSGGLSGDGVHPTTAGHATIKASVKTILGY